MAELLKLFNLPLALLRRLRKRNLDGRRTAQLWAEKRFFDIGYEMAPGLVKAHGAKVLMATLAMRDGPDQEDVDFEVDAGILFWMAEHQQELGFRLVSVDGTPFSMADRRTLPGCRVRR